MKIRTATLNDLDALTAVKQSAEAATGETPYIFRPFLADV